MFIGDFCGFLQRCLHSQPLSVLEMGCGCGVAADGVIPFLSRLQPASVPRFTLVDVDPNAVAVVAERWSSNDRVFAYVATSDMLGGSFDLVYYFLSLHHIEDIEAELCSARRLLADGGMLCVCDFEPGGNPYHLYDYSPHDGLHRSDVSRLIVSQSFRLCRSEIISQLPSSRHDGESYPLWAIAAYMEM